MKKLLAILLAMMLVMVSAFALATDADSDAESNDDAGTSGSTTGTSDYSDKLDIALTLPKNYTITHGTAPAETFNFTFTPVSYKNGAGTTVEYSDETASQFPAISNKEIAYDAAVSATTEKDLEISFTASSYQLGVYTYRIDEVIPTTKTAGVTYQTDPMYLVLTILSEGTNTYHYVAALHKGSVSGSKTDKIENSYDSGNLTVSKSITGNMADLTKKFTFTITFTAENGTEIGDAQKELIGITGGTNGSWNGLTYTVDLGNNESVAFTNIPVNTTYTVSENAQEYSSSETYSNDAKTITGGVTDTAAFTNTLTQDVDTGVTLETSAYVLIMALALAGFAMMVIRRREEY